MKSHFLLWIIPGSVHGCFQARVILVSRVNFLFSFLQHTANSLQTPKKAYPSPAGCLRGYFKAHYGQNHSLSKQPHFPQDVEQLIDTSGVETPKQLQSKYWLNIFFLFSTIGKCYYLLSIIVSFKFAVADETTTTLNYATVQLLIVVSLY